MPSGSNDEKAARLQDKFPGYYERPDEELSEFWENGLLVLDTNVLLNLYRYSAKTRDELLGVLWRVQDRLWLPHQIAEEYHRDRLTVIRVQKGAYEAIHEVFRSALEDARQKIREMHRDPGIGEAKGFLERVEKAFEGLRTQAQEFAEGAAIQSVKETDSPNDDEIWYSILELYEGKVGEGLSADRIRDVYEREGPMRYESLVPPGYKDAADKSKPGYRKYGDLILWLETIDKAKGTEKPVLLITDDRKEDWWLKRDGKLAGPRPELRNEMNREAGVPFHMLSPLDFVRWASEKLERGISDQAAGEIEELLPRDEADPVDRFELEDRLKEIEHYIASSGYSSRRFDKAYMDVHDAVREVEAREVILRRILDEMLLNDDASDLLRRAQIEEQLRTIQRFKKRHELP